MNDTPGIDNVTGVLSDNAAKAEFARALPLYTVPAGQSRSLSDLPGAFRRSRGRRLIEAPEVLRAQMEHDRFRRSRDQMPHLKYPFRTAGFYG